MAAVITGKAVTWGISGITFTFGVIAAPSANFDTAGYGVTASVKDIGSGQDDVLGQVFSHYKRRFTITVTPTGTSLSAATSSGVAWCPIPGTRVTITDTASLVNAFYNVIEATMNYVSDGNVTVNLTLEGAVTAAPVSGTDFTAAIT